MIDIDAQRTGGLLELSFPTGSKIVVNTQPPLHEIWLMLAREDTTSAMSRAVARHPRRRRVLDLLSRCASEAAGAPLRAPTLGV